MKIISLELWNEYKMWLAPLAAIFLWIISVICFVFGLSFKNPVMVMSIDATLYISFGLAMCNTIIQLIGNDMDFGDNDKTFWWIWIASYVLGISSNTNTLLQILGLNNIWLEVLIATSLGAMIEIAPEKLVKMWLRSLKTSKPKTQQPYVKSGQGGFTGQGQAHAVGDGASGTMKVTPKGFERRAELEKNRPKPRPVPNTSLHYPPYE